MFIWTYKRFRAPAALLSVLALSGCLKAGSESTSLALLANSGKPPVKALASAEIVPERVVAKGPGGYCVDKRALKAKAGGGFALLAPCGALGGTPSGEGEAVIMTIQAQLKGLGGGATNGGELAAAFAAQQPLYQETGDGLSLVQLATGGNEVIPGGEPKHWRAALSFNGYLVGLAVYSEKGGVATGARGKALLLEFAEAVLDASPLVSVDPTVPPSEAQKKPRTKLLSFLLQ